MHKKRIKDILGFSKGFLVSTLKIFFYGVITLIPILFVFWLFNMFLGGEVVNLRRVLEAILGMIFPGIKIFEWVVVLTLFLIIVGIGGLSPVLSKKIYSWIGKLIQKLLWGRVKKKGKATVIYEPYRKGFWKVGVVVGYLQGTEHLTGGRVLKIFQASVPIPVTGPAPDLVQEKDVIYVNLPAHEVLNTYTSAGILSPKKIPELVSELERREKELSEEDRKKLLGAA